MDRLTEIEVRGLFGRLDHDVVLRTDERVTILSGVNGSGKTHVLRIANAMARLNFPALAPLPFKSSSISFASGRVLTIEKLSDGVTDFEVRHRLNRLSETQSVRMVNAVPRLEEIIPSSWTQIDEDLWRDRADDEVLSTRQLAERYAGLAPDGREYRAVYDSDEEDPGWFDRLPSTPSTLIDTSRLDRLAAAPVLRGRASGRGNLNRQSPIGQYVDRIREQVAEARRLSLSVSQRADRDFASRALDKARATVKEGMLRREYERLATLSQELYENGLTEESMGLAFPADRTNPTERRILNLFLGDWQRKLDPLLPVHRKLTTLRTIVGAKFQGKKIDIQNGDLLFVGEGGDQVVVDSLSSGEQHLVALFAMLLFFAEAGGLVLIDEPEISLHASWKHQFLDDLIEVADVSDLQVIVATHSTAIINGQWELVEELSTAVSDES